MRRYVEFDRARTASAFEWKYRAWIITALYLLALACFRFDRRDIGYSVAAAWAAQVPMTLTARLFYSVAALLVFFAALLRSWTSAYAGRSTGGPYRFFSHPVYVATILLFLGFGLLLNRIGFVLLIAGMTVLFYRLLRREAVFGTESGAAWRSGVDASRENGLVRPDWRRGFLREAYLWAFGGTLVTQAITLDERLFYRALAVALVIQALCFFGRKRPLAQPA